MIHKPQVKNGVIMFENIQNANVLLYMDFLFPPSVYGFFHL
jgi:hypothetical protein